MDVLREVLLPKLEGVRMSGGSWMARCPAHDDGKASLSIARGKDHPVILNCKAGCQTVDILAAAGLTWETLCSPRDDQKPAGEWTPAGPAIAVYDYSDESGTLLFQVLRTAGKDFRQRAPDQSRKGGWRWNIEGVRRVIYRLPNVLEAVADGNVIWIAEGEKDVHALEAAGAVATCNPGGAGKWRPEYGDAFRDAIVRIVADRDKPGQAHARQVAAALEGVARAVEIVEAAGEGTDGGAALKDAADHLAAGHSLAEFVVTWESAAPAEPDLAPDLHEFLSGVDAPYDWVIESILERGDRLIWTGSEGLGKALALDTPVPTPKGWTTMGELSPGEEVFGADGKPARVTFATPVMLGRPCFRLTFSDGAQIIADAEHQWLTETLRAREARQKYARKTGSLQARGTDQKHKRLHFPAVVTTEQIRETLMARDGFAVNHSVETCAPLAYPAQELPIAPYAFGAWLGDGNSRSSQITCGNEDTELLGYIRAEGYAVEPRAQLQYLITNRPERDRRIAEGRRLMQAGMGVIAAAAHVGVGKDALAGSPARTPGDRATLHRAASAPLEPYRTVQALLGRLGVLQDKHIPRLYLEAAPSQRLALLQGLMDTDGTVTGDGAASGRGTGAATCEFTVVSERLARDVNELLLGLGIKVTFRSGPATLNGRQVGTRYRLSFQTGLPVFRLRRKAERLTPLRTRRARLRYIKAVDPVPSVPVRCIQVDSPDHLYLAGRECIPTHNTVVARQLAVAAAAGIHPFSDDPAKPQHVLWIDCENSARQGRRHFRNLERVAALKGHRVPDGGMRLIHRPEGIDLTRDEDAAWFLERVTAHKPDLLYVGPLYRLHATDVGDEVAARRVTQVLDVARVKADCALIVEGHSPHGESHGARPVRPIGSSLFRRWPEFGYGISPAREEDPCTEVVIRSWRGARDERHWPKVLMWGGSDDWPWISPADERPIGEPPPEPPHWSAD